MPIWGDKNPRCMKKETLAYLSLDLISLINVMSTFNKSIFDKYKVNTTKLFLFGFIQTGLYNKVLQG